MNRNYAPLSALSEWTVALRCPHCGRAGSGIVSEDHADGQIEPRLRVDGLSSGFVVVELRTGAGQDIRCGTCNSSALK
jgi:DNA-directed RNA polymerase subunit RPC12/RpoP